jgi:hypothetical protein
MLRQKMARNDNSPDFEATLPANAPPAGRWCTATRASDSRETAGFSATKGGKNVKMLDIIWTACYNDNVNSSSFSHL